MQRFHRLLLIASFTLTSFSVVGYFRYTTSTVSASTDDQKVQRSLTFGSVPSESPATVEAVAGDVDDDKNDEKDKDVDVDKDKQQSENGDVATNDTAEWEPSPEMSMALSDNPTCIKKFLKTHGRRCRNSLPIAENVPIELVNKKGGGSLPKVLCPCIPKNLLGSLSLITDRKRPHGYVEMSLKSMSSRNQGQDTSGGRWFPSDCVARQRVAIIVPYRKREEHLHRLLFSLHPALQRQLLDYTIFVIEQRKPAIFNRATLMNVGYKEAKATGRFDCLIFHDVDMYPIDDRNFYTCSPSPRHMARYRDKRAFSYHKYFGGIVAIRPSHFVKVNGMSNKFYGWGGEDDEFLRRLETKKISVSPHYPKCVAAYTTPFHTRDKGNEVSKSRYLYQKRLKKRVKKDGLSSLKYTVVEKQKQLLYTKIVVNLPPPKKH